MQFFPSLTALATVLFLAALSTARLAADDYDTLRLKWRDIIAGTGYDTADPDVAARLTSIANAANSNWASMDKSPTRTKLWTDLASTTISSHITSSYSRLRAMALAWATPGCSLFGNASLLGDITGGLDWMNTNRYNATSAQYDNWWDWEIGSPIQLTDICVLLFAELSAAQLTNYMNAVEHQVPTPDMTQANKVWKARAVGVRGCLVKSSAKLALCRDAFSSVFPYVTTGDGYYSDGSFIQHDYHPYTAGYGASLIATMAPLLNWLSGSTWAVTDPAQANLFRWVFDSYEPVIYRGNTFDLVRGREAGRANSTPNGHGMLDSILQIAQFAPPADAARMKSLVKEWALTDTQRDFVSGRGLATLTMAKSLMDDAAIVPRGELVTHYTFAEMDRVIHLGEGYGFGLTMCSTRIANFESINGENLRGWFTGDGQTTLYNADLAAFSDSYWATVDHYRLPGVTADVTHSKLPHQSAAIGPRAQGQSTRSPHSWAGGATLGKFGAAGMQFKGVGVTLTGKKSWFMFDDEIVCLGAGITSTDSRPIETTVENRKLNTVGSNAFTVNGTAKPAAPGWSETMPGVSWAHLAGDVPGSDIGWFFPTSPTLKGVREARTGSWSDIDSDGSTTPITRNYLRITFEHGSNPSNATYRYVLLPGRNARRTSQYAENPHVTILANNGNVQAVTENTLGITAANFWTDTSQTAGGITADRKCSVLVRNDGTFVEVALSDPTQLNTGAIALQIAQNGGTLVSADAGITVTQTTPSIAMNVSTSGAAGRTFRARFFLGTPQTPTLAPVADAYVYDAAASVNSNFGTATSLVVKKSSAGFNRESFLRFDVPPGGGVLLGASLELACLSASIPGVHGVAVVTDNAWLESGAGGITWNNKPSASGTVLSTWTPAAGATSTADVTDGITGTGLHSFKVYGTTQTQDGFVTFGSRENGTAANRPRLVLTRARTPPAVTLTSPEDGGWFTKIGPVAITADAAATDGAISAVAFYDGATLLGTDTTAPYSIQAVLGGGAHFLRAEATDVNGLTGASLTRRVDMAFPPLASGAALSTPAEAPVDADLRTLTGDVETPISQLRYSPGTATNGTVTLLPDGHTAPFTPAAGYSGPASFSYTVTDTGYDPRTVLHYDLQGDADDRSGAERHGTLNVQGTGAATFASGTPPALGGLYGQSLALTASGTAGAARLERSLGVGECDFRNGDWTIAGWFKRDSTADIDTVLQLGESGGWGSNALSLVLPAGSASIELRNFNGGTQDVGIVKTGVTAGAWHHFAVVRDGPTINLYINGAPAGMDGAFAFSFDATKPVKFGGVAFTSMLDRWLDGSLADIAIFNAPLTATETAAVASAPVPYFGGQSASATVNVSVLSAYDQWRQAHFGTTANTGPAADTADPDGDGFRNKLEFLLGRSPVAQDPASSRPSVTRAGSTLEFTYTRSLAAAGMFIAVAEWSDTLAPASWSTAGVTEQIVSTGATTEQVKAVIPAGTAARRFIRLRIP